MRATPLIPLLLLLAPLAAAAATGPTYTPYAALLWQGASPAVRGHEGYAIDGSERHLIDVTELRVYNAAMTSLLRQNLTALAGTGLNHFGDGDAFAGHLYVAAESWSGSCATVTSPTLTVYNTTTLELERSAPATGMVEIAAVAVVPAGDAYGFGGAKGTIYAASWCASNRIEKYDLDTLAHNGTITLAQTLRNTQGLAYGRGALYVQDIDRRVFAIDLPLADSGIAPVRQLVMDRPVPEPGAGEGLAFSEEPNGPTLHLHKDEGAPVYAHVYRYRLIGGP